MRAGVLLRRLLLLCVLAPALIVAGAAAARAATLTPNTTVDEVVPNDGKCSLREAVQAVNSPGTKTDCGTADASSNLIVLGPKTYQLSIPPGVGDSDPNCLHPSKLLPPPDQSASGDLCIRSNASLVIAGRGPQSTMIAGQTGFNDRLITISDRGVVTISGITMTGGTAPNGEAGLASCGLGTAPPVGPPPPPCPNGGAIYNGGMLTLTGSDLTGNHAGDAVAGGGVTPSNSPGGSGGGAYNVGALFVTDTTITGNAAGAGDNGEIGVGSGPGGVGAQGGNGGGIASSAGQVLVARSTIFSNAAGGGGTGGVGGPSNGNGGNGGPGGDGGGIYSTSGSMSINNSTLASDSSGAGGKGGAASGSGTGGNGGVGGNGGGVALSESPSSIRNATIASNNTGAGGSGGSGGGAAGGSGDGGGLYVNSSMSANDLTLQNSLVASNAVHNCALGLSADPIANGGHNLSFPDSSCPAAVTGNPNLGALRDNGGPTETMALGPGSAAIDQVPRTGAGCPSTDQRGVSRPQGSACDIGSFEFALPRIAITAPGNGARYKRGSRVLAEYLCTEGGTGSPIVTCNGTVQNGKKINTSTRGKKTFTVTSTDKNGNTSTKTVHYTVIR